MCMLPNKTHETKLHQEVKYTVMEITKNVQRQPKTAQESTFWRRVATNFRKKRFELFKTLIASVPKPFTMLDVGGTKLFWESMGYSNQDLNIIVLNTAQQQFKTSSANMTSVAGDARSMPEYKDKQFEVVFSNSVIEHVGSFEDQRHMAQEVQRIGQRYYVQTPNRYFPIEPHFLIPFFQFYPSGLKVFIVTHFKTPWGWKIADKEKARSFTSSIRLMTEKELRAIFPEATIYKEKFMGLTKSYTAYKGW
jgi:ubiquinone/menaquinone biosynthesis C-methylase UbiE